MPLSWQVHEPVNAPFSYIRKQDPAILDSTRRTYAAMVSAVDEGIANLTASLRAASMWQNTLLVISNDNGGWAPGCCCCHMRFHYPGEGGAGLGRVEGGLANVRYAYNGMSANVLITHLEYGCAANQSGFCFK